MKKIILISLMLIAFIGVQAQITIVKEDVSNPLTKVDEVVILKAISIYYGDLNQESLDKGNVSVISNTQKFLVSYAVCTYKDGKGQLVEGGVQTYVIEGDANMATLKEDIDKLVNNHVTSDLKKRYNGDGAGYAKGYNVVRKPITVNEPFK